METPPHDRAEFWVRFVCGFFFFGSLAGLIGLRFLDSLGAIPTLVGIGCATLVMSIYVARVGDEGWRTLLEKIRWW